MSDPSFAPMVQRLRQELPGRDTASALADPRSPDEFSQWYLDAIQVLEGRVAQGEGHPPMTRREVELLCRCSLSASRLDEAISCVVDFCAMLQPRAGRPELVVENGRATFWLDSLRLQPSAAACLVDLTGLYAYLQLFGWLIDEPLNPHQVMLGHPNREDAGPFLYMLSAPVTANHNRYGFVFDASLLKRPVLKSPQQLPPFLHSFPCALLGSTQTTTALDEKIRLLLRAAINQQQLLPDAAQVASTLGMSVATLRRRLGDIGSSYRALREQSLLDAAIDYLDTSDNSIEAVAQRLGFSDGPSFRRAFRRWTGRTPQDWRRRSTN